MHATTVKDSCGPRTNVTAKLASRYFFSILFIGLTPTFRNRLMVFADFLLTAFIGMHLGAIVPIMSVEGFSRNLSVPQFQEHQLLLGRNALLKEQNLQKNVGMLVSLE